MSIHKVRFSAIIILIVTVMEWFYYRNVVIIFVFLSNHHPKIGGRAFSYCKCFNVRMVLTFSPLNILNKFASFFIRDFRLFS